MLPFLGHPLCPRMLSQYERTRALDNQRHWLQGSFSMFMAFRCGVAQCTQDRTGGHLCRLLWRVGNWQSLPGRLVCRRRPSVSVHVRLQNLDGWGESYAVPNPWWSGEVSSATIRFESLVHHHTFGSPTVSHRNNYLSDHMRELFDFVWVFSGAMLEFRSIHFEASMVERIAGGSNMKWLINRLRERVAILWWVMTQEI